MGSGFECWCCVARRVVVLRGEIVGRRQAEVLRVSDCGVQGCAWRGCRGCLVGCEVEGRW